MNAAVSAKRTIYLADLGYVRPGREWTIIPVPLNVAYLAAFLEKMRPGVFEIRIFKNPLQLLAAIDAAPPDIAAFSNYIWNKNLQLACARHLKARSPRTVTVMGGPNYNFQDAEWMTTFARENAQIDFHIEGEGEVKFFNLVACVEAHGYDAAATKRALPAGVAFIDERGALVSSTVSDTDAWHSLDGIELDRKAGRLLDLNEVPSPYLTGVLDEFLLDPNYCPIIETNRGCPYECTFCNWGDMGKSRSSKFSLERVRQELDYIAAKNVSKTPYLYIGDANFGLFERDVEIATWLRDLKQSHGFPHNVYLYFAKNSSERVVRIAEILNGMTRINLSRQTQNDEVLRHIKRSNIAIETFSSLTDLARRLGLESFVELIYGLPGESKESFFNGLKSVMRQQVDGIHLFPAMLLDGSEMGSRASRDLFGLRGEFRRIDGCAGTYGPVEAMEFEEIVTSTRVLSRDDYFDIRLFHFFQTLFLDTKLYRDTEVLIGDAMLFDLIEDLIRHQASAPAPVRELIRAFVDAAKAEFVEDPTRIDVHAALAKDGGLVKLNPLFICKLLHDPGVRPAFHAYLRERLLTMGHASASEIDLVLSHIDASIYPFDGASTKTVTSTFDAAAFSRRHFGGGGRASDFVLPEPRAFRFTKPFTYQTFIDAMPAEQPLAAKVYEVVLHHTHEIMRKTLSWTIDAETSPAAGRTDSDGRHIENEGGWVY